MLQSSSLLRSFCLSSRLGQTSLFLLLLLISRGNNVTLGVITLLVILESVLIFTWAKLIGISPSIYIAYTGLKAIATSVNGEKLRGKLYDTTTIAYNQDAIKIGCGWEGPWVPINIDDFHNKPNNSYMESRGNCQSVAMLEESEGYTTAAVWTAGNSPEGQAANDLAVDRFFSMPAELSDVDPAWKTCTPVYRGAWDPPRVLIPVANLRPTTISAPTSTLLPRPPNSVSSSIPAAMTSQKSSTDQDPIPLFGQLLHPSKSKASMHSLTDRKVDTSTAPNTLVTSGQPKKGGLSSSHTKSKESHPTTRLSATDRMTLTSLDPETNPSGPHVQADTVGSEPASSQTETQEDDPIALSRMVAAMAQAAKQFTTPFPVADISSTSATTSPSHQHSPYCRE